MNMPFGRFILFFVCIVCADRFAHAASFPYPELSGRLGYFPPVVNDNWKKLDPATAGWDRARLQNVVDYVGEHNSTAFIVLQSGYILSENYWQGWDGNTSADVYSVGKTVAGFLLGRQLETGLVNSLFNPISDYLGAGWLTNTFRSCETYPMEHSLRIWHAATMTSGLRGGPVNISCASYHPPFTEWYYNTAVYRKIVEILDLRAPQGSIQAYAKEELFDKIGMKNASWVETYNLSASARDMARFGLLLLHNGTWSGQKIIEDKNYLTLLKTPSNPFNPAYGLLTWLNGKSSYILPNSEEIRQGSMIPAAPNDMYMALGSGDKKIYIVPSLDVVVVRHGGQAAVNDLVFDRVLWRLLCAADSACRN